MTQKTNPTHGTGYIKKPRCKECDQILPTPPKKFTDKELRKLMIDVADIISNAERFVDDGCMAYNGNALVSVFSLTASRRCAYGWILALAYERSGKRNVVAEQIADIVNAHVLKKTGNSLIGLGDDIGRIAVIKALRACAKDAKMESNKKLVQNMYYSPPRRKRGGEKKDDDTIIAA